MQRLNMIIVSCVWLVVLGGLVSCASNSGSSAAPVESPEGSTPPPAIQAWMDRLTVPHRYDPETGFIVATQTVALPPEIGEAPPLDQAVAIAASDGRTVIAFATADRCAPCQQYKKNALNDPRVIERLGDARLIATHVEVDRAPELADRYLGGGAIPMTYALRDGERIAMLRGQRTAEDLLAWLDEVAPPQP